MADPSPLTLTGNDSRHVVAETSLTGCNTEDSLFALSISYEVLRDRFNKLKAENRSLILHCRACMRCRKTSNGVCSVTENPVVSLPPRPEADAVQNLSDGLLDTTELIRQVASLRLKLERAMSTGSGDRELPSLPSAVESLTHLERQMSRSPDALVPLMLSATIEDDKDDESNLSELNDVNNLIIEQFEELACVCEMLRQQNAMLHDYVREMFDRKPPPHSPAYFSQEADWSYVSSSDI